MDAHVGQVIQHPIRSSLTGTITNLYKYADGKDGDYVKVSWHDGTEGSLYAALAEPYEPYVPPLAELLATPVPLVVGDDVGHILDKEALGVITRVNLNDYVVRWTDGFNFTTEPVENLILLPKSNPPSKIVFEDADIITGERVFFKHSNQYPLGVVEYIDTSESEITYHVRWDNGVYVEHTKNDIGSCALMIDHLSQPIRQVEGI